VNGCVSRFVEEQDNAVLTEPTSSEEERLKPRRVPRWAARMLRGMNQQNQLSPQKKARLRVDVRELSSPLAYQEDWASTSA